MAARQRFRKRGRSYKDNVICNMIDDLGYPEIPVVIVAKLDSTHEAGLWHRAGDWLCSSQWAGTHKAL
jgi:hypothetical protein